MYSNYIAQHKGLSVIIKIGYDERIHGFYMTVEPVDEGNPNANPETGMIYSNLSDKFIPFPGMTKDLNHYKKCLEELDINKAGEIIAKAEIEVVQASTRLRNNDPSTESKYEKISVSASALGQLLLALSGPDHHILELKYTRSVSSLLPGFNSNPINTLVAEWNAYAKQLADQPPSMPEGSPPT